VGLTLMLNTLWPLVLFVPMLIVIHWGIIRREEQYLEAKFGDAYLAYKSRVRRWL
jgi:protein-S-isoprenylcysteine O-methyltransferase Ste14